MPATPTNIAVTIAEVGLLVAGLVLLWRYVLTERARKARRESGGLPAWEVSVSDFLLFAFLMIAGGLVAGMVAGAISTRWNLAEDARTIVGSAAFQLGLLIGPALLPFYRTSPLLRPSLRASAFSSGLATFLIALPIVTLVNLAWLQFLKVQDFQPSSRICFGCFQTPTNPP